jgi:transcriptional regulator with XRE-family HTH domain
MNLNEEDIRRALKKYQQENNKTGVQMTELLGMSSTSMYSQYKNGETKELKAAALVRFILNTKIDLEKFLNKNFKVEEEELLAVSEAKIKYFECPECIKKQKEIDDYRQKYIECLEELACRQKKTS